MHCRSKESAWSLCLCIAVFLIMIERTPIASGCPPIVSRAQWGARRPRSVSYLTRNQPLRHVFIHHSAGGSCFTRESCAAKVRGFQNDHMDNRTWSDIGYSFLVGGDGSIFEGRGWDRTGAHTRGYNSRSLGICLIGNFESDHPTANQMEVTDELIGCGTLLGRLSPDYQVRGHKDVGTTACPGQHLYDIIRQWHHYSD